jgi:hypothetical protein
MAAKRKLADLSPENEEPIDPSDELMFLCLGGGNEVGRSCHIIQYKGKTIMVGRFCEAGMKRVLMLNSLTQACTQHMTVLPPYPFSTSLTCPL